MRHTVRGAIITTITSAVSNSTVLVDYAWPGETGGKDMIWLGTSTGSSTVPVFRGLPSVGNPIVLDDEFTIPVHIYAGSVGSSYKDAEARADALYDLIRATLAADPGLGSLTDSQANPHAFLLDAVISGLDGPHTGEDPTGPASWFTTTITCHTREQ